MPLRIDLKPALPKVSELIECKASHLHRDDISHEKRERFFNGNIKKKNSKKRKKKLDNKRDRHREQKKEDDAMYHIDIKI